MNDNSFFCSHCGKEHPKTELSFAASFPDEYFKLSSDERETRAILGSDQCVIDGEQFFIRGCIELPVLESRRIFLWGVWAQIHEKDYDEIAAHWTAEGRETKIGPYNGRLANSLPVFEESLNLKLKVQIEPAGSRPLFLLEEPDHPMTIEQQSGITMQKAEQYLCLLTRLAGS